MSISQRIIEATREIFTSMVMMDITPGEPITTEINPLRSSITGMIGLAGTHKGMLAIHIPDRLAMTITGNFLGMEVAELNADVQDAVGELANMLGGSVKTILSGNGKDIKLSLPSTILGKEYTFQCQDEVEMFLLPFSAPGGEFMVELRLEKEC